MKAARLTAVTANIGRGVGTAEAVRNINAVVKGFRQTTWRRNPAAIGWQEIDEADAPDEHDALHHAVSALTPGSVLVGFPEATPISVPAGWTVIRDRVTKTCEGRAKVTPHRVCVQALIEDDATGCRVVLANGHYPHNAWDLWEICNQSWIEIMDFWTIDQGYSVVTTRDRNKRGIGDSLSPWEVPLLPAVLLDKISVIQAPPGPRATRIQGGKPRRVELTIDGHNAHGVPLSITPFPARPGL